VIPGVLRRLKTKDNAHEILFLGANAAQRDALRFPGLTFS
jgi:hypothetical protein